LAGHETSATTLCWVLLELARHPAVQAKLREEIWATQKAIHARGGSDFSAADLDNMPYLAAVIKVIQNRTFNQCTADFGFQESMRFHPAVYQNYRQSVKDDVLPLSTPIRTLDGKLINQLPIPKGMKVILSIAGYNRSIEAIYL